MQGNAFNGTVVANNLDIANLTGSSNLTLGFTGACGLAYSLQVIENVQLCTAQPLPPTPSTPSPTPFPTPFPTPSLNPQPTTLQPTTTAQPSSTAANSQVSTTASGIPHNELIEIIIIVIVIVVICLIGVNHQNTKLIPIFDNL